MVHVAEPPHKRPSTNADRVGRANQAGLVGTYDNVSKKYLPFYLNEFSFRFNNRKNEEMFADLITTCAQ